MKKYLDGKTTEELKGMLLNVYKALESSFPNITCEEEQRVKLDLIGLEFPFGSYISQEMEKNLMIAKAQKVGISVDEFIEYHKTKGCLDEYGRPTAKGVQEGTFCNKEKDTQLLILGKTYKTFRTKSNDQFIIIHMNDEGDKLIGLNSFALFFELENAATFLANSSMQKTIKDIQEKTGKEPIRFEEINGIYDQYFDVKLWIDAYGEFNAYLWRVENDLE